MGLPAKKRLDRVEVAGPIRVDIGMVGQVAALRVLGNVVELVDEIFCVADSVMVEAGLPDFARVEFPDCVGESAFDALNAAFDGLGLCGG